MGTSKLAWSVSLMGVLVAAAATEAQPVAPLLPPEYTVPAVDNATDPIWNVTRPRFAAGYTTGPGFGYQNGFTTLDGFWPILGNGTNDLVFLDTRGLLSDDRLRWGNNLELGYRRYSPERDRIYGIWTSWDLRNTSAATYNQISGGVETFGRLLDAHANWYAVTGPQYTQTSAYILNAPTFSGHNILLPTVVNYESALSGTDLEVGGRLPYLGQYGLRGYVGGYAFRANTYGGVGGGQARLLARISNNMDVNLQVRTDNAFGTTVVVGGALRWGGLRRQYQQPERDSVYNRMADPTERIVNVSVVDKSRGFNQLALNPTTGQPLSIVFVNNQAPAGGDGTFLHPLNTLAFAPGVAGANGIIALEPGNGMTTNQNSGITLLGGQHLLGTGVPNFIVSQQGVFTLPAIGTGTPVITNTAGAGTVILNNNNEVANLSITNPFGSGIVGSNISNFNIHGVGIVGGAASTGSGISIMNASGLGQITNTSATAMQTDGLTVNQTTGNFGLVVVNSSFDANNPGNPTSNGITLATSNNATLVAQIQGGSTSGNGNNGIDATSADTSALSLFISNHTSSNNVCCGISLNATGTSALAATIVNSTLSGNATDGITAIADPGAQMPLVVSGNTINGNGLSGVFYATNGTPLNPPAQLLTVTNNIINDNTGNGIEVSMTGGSLQSVNVSSNAIARNEIGISIINQMAAPSTVVVANNITSANRSAGISLQNISSGTLPTNSFNYHVTGNTLNGDNTSGAAAGGVVVSNTNGFTSVNLQNNVSMPANGSGYVFENNIAMPNMVVFAPPHAPASASDPRANVGSITPIGLVTFTASPGP